jgi:hypothetical protein
MASGGKRGGAGERVLESRHVIGLFMLMLLFSGVFFTLAADGNRMAVARLAAGTSDVWVVDIARDSPARLTFDPSGEVVDEASPELKSLRDRLR